MRLYLYSTLLLPFALSMAIAQSSDFESRYATLRENESDLSDSARLHALFELDWEYDMATFPEWATWEGRYERNGEWTDNSAAAQRVRDLEMEWPMQVIESIDRDELPESERLNYDLYRKQLERSLEGRTSPDRYIIVSQLGGRHQSVPRLFEIMPKRSVKDFEDILSRMRGLPRVVANDIATLQRGLVLGITPPKVTLRDVPDQIAALLSDDPTESPLYEPFRTMPKNIPVDEQNRLREEAVRLYRDSVAPAFGSLHSYLVNTYIPAARTSIGYALLPDGKKWYSFRVEGYTTTTLTPEKIFEIGQKEVARIRAEMEKVVAESEFEGTLEEFEDFLRNDPQFYYDDAEELLRGYRDICKRADPELARLFGTLPRLPYGVSPIPDFMAPSQTTAYYVGGSNETGRPGIFFANTYDLASRPTWEMEPLALHEAVPGHHLQISLAAELEGLPRWRRDAGYTAFVEGWGLYAESLGEEMGFYTTPYTKYGQLSYQMWRAIRLVVDVGIHQMGWTRQEAIDFFDRNSGKPLHDIEVEIDRYIVWPGQALAYKIGEMKIVELREYAKKQLGDRFDIREFHDQLLLQGALPLDILEHNIREWEGELRIKN